MDKRSASVLEVERKVLHRRTVADLADGSVLATAVDLVLDQRTANDDLERLAFLIVLFRQVTLSVSNPAVVSLAETVIGPLLLPRGPFSATILAALANPIKPHPLRASEALSAAARMCASVTSNESLLAPLLAEVLRDGLAARPNLVAVNAIVEHVPADQVPADLLPRLLADLSVAENANVRSAAVATLLGRRRESPADTERARDEVMFAPLIPLLGRDDDGATVQNVRRYLLDPLFTTRRASFPTLLEMLSSRGDEYFAAWITVASFGVSTGLIGIDGLNMDRLQDAIVHQDHKIRVLAFELVAINKSVLESEVMELVKESLRWNQDVTHPGARTDLASGIHTFFAHLKALEWATVRDEKKAKTPEIRTTLRRHIATSNAFHKWLVQDHLVPMISGCRSTPSIRAIFGLRLLQLYLDAFKDRQEVISAVYIPDMVTLLIACQASEFADIRSQAKRIIIQGPYPLPGYETPDVPLAKALLTSARASINHPRNTQAEAGRAALSIIFTKLVQPLGAEASVAFVTGLIDTLEGYIVKSEENLSSGIVEFPLHGSLGVLADVMCNLDLKSPEAQTVWSPVLHRLFALVDRVWAVTRQVISLGPTENENGTAAHEIARAVEVLGDGDEEGGDEGLDHTNLLSACWRATREAAEVLSALITVPLGSKQQSVWSRKDMHHAGLTFLTWMHEVRHRGTFSKIAPALGLVVEAVKKHPEVRDLVDVWLGHELDTIAEGTISTLRRSAALPYSLLAIVSSDQTLLDRAVDRLVNMARLGPATADTTKVHAMNCLKIVLLDTKQARFFNRYFERTLTVALAAFGSSNWNVRNVGLTMFSTMAHRSLATPHSHEVFGTRAALAGRQTLASWHSRFPSIIPHIREYLRRARSDGPATLSQHSPLFPILIIIRSLRWSSEGDDVADMLFPVVEPYLGSVEWQVREVAAQALSSLLSPAAALEKAKVTATRVSHDTDDYNTLHGRLLFLRRLISDVLSWSEAGDTDKKMLELRLRDALQVHVDARAVIPKEILACLNAYAAETSLVSPAFLPKAKRSALSFLARSTYTPGLDLLHDAAAQTVLLDATTSDAITLLAPTMAEDAQLAALDAIETHSRLQTTETLTALLRLCTAGAGAAVLTRAYAVLAAWPASPAADTAITALAEHLWRAVASRCVPLREAALVALGRVTAVAPLADRLRALADRLAAASDENKSEPSRTAALASLTHLAPLLDNTGIEPATRASLQQTLLRLLEDDDADIRAGAQAIASAGRLRPLVLGKAAALWWSGAANAAGEEVWRKWLWETALARADTDADIEALTAPQSTDVLFVQEPPNIFRNALADSETAAVVLAELGLSDVPERADARQLAARVTAALETPVLSPIEAAWEPRRRLRRRAELLSRLL